VEAGKKTKDKLDSDAESDKENILPCRYGKRKGKLLQLDQIKISKTTEANKNVAQEIEISNAFSKDNSNNTVSILNLPISNKHIEIVQEDLNINHCFKSKCQNVAHEICFDSIIDTRNLQHNKISCYDNAITTVGTTVENCSQYLLKCNQNDKKTNKSPTVIKNKQAGRTPLNKINNKYVTIQSQNAIKITNDENIISNCASILTSKNSHEVIEENIIFEGTVINSTDDTSIIMPLKSELHYNKLMFDNTLMADDSKIVQAQEIIWIPNNCGLNLNSKNSKLIDTNQSKAISPIPEGAVQILEKNEKLVVNNSEQEMKLTTSTELFLLDVQLPVQENSVAIPKNIDILKIKQSLLATSSECKDSEGKFVKISDLMTDKQKRDIEMHYKIDMTLVDELKVDKNILVLDKCKFKCKICEVIYPRLDKCQVSLYNYFNYFYQN
jgi:hypothetical protein